MEKSKIIRGTSKCARFFVCDTTEIVREAKKIHDLDPIATTIFGKLLTATAMMGKANRVYQFHTELVYSRRA